MFHRAYISTARRLSPYVPKELEEYIATAYSGMRQEEAKSNTPHSYTTVRTLLSILRISAVSPDFHLFSNHKRWLFWCIEMGYGTLSGLGWAKGGATSLTNYNQDSTFLTRVCTSGYEVEVENCSAVLLQADFKLLIVRPKTPDPIHRINQLTCQIYLDF